MEREGVNPVNWIPETALDLEGKRSLQNNINDPFSTNDGRCCLRKIALFVTFTCEEKCCRLCCFGHPRSQELIIEESKTKHRQLDGSEPLTTGKISLFIKLLNGSIHLPLMERMNDSHRRGSWSRNTYTHRLVGLLLLQFALIFQQMVNQIDAEQSQRIANQMFVDGNIYNEERHNRDTKYELALHPNDPKKSKLFSNPPDDQMKLFGYWEAHEVTGEKQTGLPVG